ncbi:MAG: aminoglycoside phosphotransferase family protein [Acidobacteria bacterium]|jgi:aminoglycoside phosphotransferase (APT) family kinase protein|nr:aminoglycoside phosphotransferase family protein [Acidobacteriota bacterium]
MELDIENFDDLRQYMMQQGHVHQGERIVLHKLAGGVSNRTVLVSWPDRHGWVLKQALAKLRVAVDWFSDPERIAVEAKALRWLNHAAPPGSTPGFVFEDTSRHILAMQAIPEGHENWKSLLLAGEIVPDHFEQFGVLLGAIHRQSTEHAAQLAEEFADTRYFESLRLEPYYLYTAQQVPDAAGFLRALASETLRHKDCLVHGDFSPKNTLLYQDKLILLDYEVMHFGDPAFDVGFAMAHFLSKAHHLPRHHDQVAAGAERFLAVYRRQVAALAWAGELEPRMVRHSLGCSLARVAGKSTLEYLSREEMERQRHALLPLLANPPATVDGLIGQFLQNIRQG